MASAREAREARRKRIADRGADRLAFITGQISSLTPENPPSFSEPKSPLPQVSTEFEKTTVTSVVPNIEPEIETVDRKLENLTEEKTSPPPSVMLSGENGASDVQELGMDTEAIWNLLNKSIEEQPSLPPSSIIRAPESSTTVSYIDKHFTSDSVIAAISATENIRLLCAVLLAVLVLTFGRADFTSSGILKGIIASRPIYLLLLTDITLVVGFIILGGKGGEALAAGSRKPDQETGLVENLSKVLKNALLVQKAMNSAFMDCSVYAVVLISFLCLGQYWE